MVRADGAGTSPAARGVGRRPDRHPAANPGVVVERDAPRGDGPPRTRSSTTECPRAWAPRGGRSLGAPAHSGYLALPAASRAPSHTAGKALLRSPTQCAQRQGHDQARHTAFDASREGTYAEPLNTVPHSGLTEAVHERSKASAAERGLRASYLSRSRSFRICSTAFFVPFFR